MEKGMEKGINQRNIEIAKKLLSQNIAIETIILSTGLSMQDIKELK